jgi:AraC-like DNA-binding protein
VPLPYRRFRWELALWVDVWVQKRLRFTTAEIRRILSLLYLDEIQWSYRYKPSPEKAFAIFLMRLSWPLRLHDLVEVFGCSQSQLSQIFNDVVIFLTQRF